MEKYDLGVIGSGPSGYVAAIRAAQLGLRVCVFEKEKVGGVCLNWGCIPTKALSASAGLLSNIKKSSEFGVNVKDYELDFNKVIERKNSIVAKLTGGISFLFKKNKIDFFNEEAKLKDNKHIVTKEREVEISNILVCTGSRPFEIPGMEFDEDKILSSTGILNLDKLPKSLLIVGGGVIGCEFASIFNAFSVNVTIVEMMKDILPLEDEGIARKLTSIFKKRSINIFTDTKVEGITKKDQGIEAKFSNGNVLKFDKALISIGRLPNSKGFGLEAIGVEFDKRGWIKVDKNFKTNIDNIYAGGDVNGGILLAHLASREGIVAVERIAGKESSINYNVIPSAIFTHPEIASVGKTLKKAKEENIDAISHKFLFGTIGKSHVLGEIDGFVKVVVDSKTDKILGAQIIGPHATELIAQFSPCIQYGIKSKDLADVIQAHPTLSEIVREAAESVHNKAIHG